MPVDCGAAVWRPAIIWGGIFVALVMVSLCATVLYQGRLDAMDRARETSRNLALIAERDIERNFELYALSLQAVVDGMRDPDVLALPPRQRRQMLFDRAATAKYLGSMLVLDASGNIVIDSGSDIPRKGNFADRKYFIIQRDNPNVGLYISDPYASRLRGGSPSIALTRRLSHPDGSFAGVVLIAVNLEYFHNLFAGLSLGSHGAVSLIGQDGIMVMRQPYDVRTIGRDIRRPARSSISGRHRKAASRTPRQSMGCAGFTVQEFSGCPADHHGGRGRTGYLCGLAAARIDHRFAIARVWRCLYRALRVARRAATPPDTCRIGIAVAGANRRPDRPEQSPYPWRNS